MKRVNNETNTKAMNLGITNKQRNLIKKNILKCLTEDFKNNQAIFDKKDGYQIFNGTDLDMVMDKVVKGLEFSKVKDKRGKADSSDESAALPLHGVSGSLPFNKYDAVKMLTAFLRDTVEMINGKRFAPSLRPEYWFDEYVKRGQ